MMAHSSEKNVRPAPRRTSTTTAATAATATTTSNRSGRTRPDACDDPITPGLYRRTSGGDRDPMVRGFGGVLRRRTDPEEHDGGDRDHHERAHEAVDPRVGQPLPKDRRRRNGRPEVQREDHAEGE